LKKTAILVLEDGTIFNGKSIGINGITVGEVVFNTSITGYQEILTDPSYANQIITFTHPHIGNVGVNNDDAESNKIHAKGIIIRDLSISSSNYRSECTFPQYLKNNQIIAISDIDTRKLTRILRIKGFQYGCIMATETLDVNLAQKTLKNYLITDNIDVVSEVTTKSIYICKNKKSIYHVVVYDFGIKKNILRLLLDRGCYLTIVPAHTNANDVLQLSPNGIFLSNGPGDPRLCHHAISAIKIFLKKNIPMFGICLGHQLLAIASGAKIIKMKFGHHGGNHPVKDINNNCVMITTQNHNFTVDHKTIPNNIKITHLSLFDNSLQGITRKDKFAFGFQGHPEASPGPHDSALLFDHFIQIMKNNLILQEKK